MDGIESSYEGSYDGRKSALPERIEVRVRSERRRSWSSKDKLEIGRETLASGAVAQVVADRHGISTGLIYTWRKQMLKAAMAGFAVVEIKPDTSIALPGPQTPSLEPLMMVEGPSASSGLIEVELSGGVRLRVGSDVDGAALQRLLAALSASRCCRRLRGCTWRAGSLICAIMRSARLCHPQYIGPFQQLRPFIRPPPAPPARSTFPGVY
jgi:transposase